MSLQAAFRGCQLQARRSGLAAARRQISSKVIAAAIPRANVTAFSRQLRTAPRLAQAAQSRMTFGTDAKKGAKGLELVLDVDSDNINQVCSCCTQSNLLSGSFVLSNVDLHASVPGIICPDFPLTSLA